MVDQEEQDYLSMLSASLRNEAQLLGAYVPEGETPRAIMLRTAANKLLQASDSISAALHSVK